jgi:hypothetical protein
MVVVFLNLISILDFSYSFPISILNIKQIFLALLLPFALTTITNNRLTSARKLAFGDRFFALITDLSA